MYNYLNLDSFHFGKYFQFVAIFAGVALLFGVTQCKKDPVVLAPLNLDVVFFGHKGGGNNNFNKRFIENTLPSIQDGLKSMNGVEVDVQMSLDGTVWIYHNGDIGETSCQANYHHCLILLKDSEIEKIQICANNIQDRIYKLKELVDYWKVNNEGFPISMHIKTDMGRDTLNHPLIGGELAYLLKLADKLAILYPSIQNQDRIFVEIFDGAFRNKIHATIPRMKVCLLKEVPFKQQVDDAISGGYDGVSSGFDNASISAAEVKRARDNGLIVQLWTPDTKDEIIQAYSLKPNHIQTDNMYGAIICEPYYVPAK
ncbi:MAG: glycerophosphodiester phosphodiesterase family protein [Mariniphaga sp.]